MDFTDTKLIDLVIKGDLRALARLITLVENRSPRARPLQSKLFKRSGKAHVVGVTGAPGAGKSTLVDQLAKRWHAKGKKVAVLAIDPSSPFTGGAVLGDRIRMSHSVEIPEIYIRSMATRGALGGISAATVETVLILDAAGFDLILVETVGVGQGEVDIIKTADTSLVVLVPGMGDSVQAIKAGILEIADAFVINKADRDGADVLQKDLRGLLSLADYQDEDWRPEILRSIATKGEGSDEIIEACRKHNAWLSSTGEGRKCRLRNMRETVLKLARELVEERAIVGEAHFQKLIEECLNKTRDPFSVADELVKEWR